MSTDAIKLETRALDVRFGALRALNDVSLTFDGPARIGLIGPNGAGKSTLLNALTGFVSATSGSIALDGQELSERSPQQHVRQGILRSFQTPRILEDETVLTNVLLGTEHFRKPGVVRQLVGTPGARRSESALRREALDALDRLSLAHLAGRQAANLSTAVRRLVELARVLVAKPRILLIDEPAAGLDAKSRVQLADTLRRTYDDRPCLIVLVEHDVSIVRRVCERTVVLVSGSVLAEGETEEVLRRDDVRAAYFGDRDADR